MFCILTEKLVLEELQVKSNSIDIKNDLSELTKICTKKLNFGGIGSKEITAPVQWNTCIMELSLTVTIYEETTEQCTYSVKSEASYYFHPS